MPQTVVQHVLSRLKQLGVRHVFGVPGDFAFPINDAICEDKDLTFVGSCNELNTAYSADGYVRLRGFGALNTTYGVGELSALCGVAGAYSEHLPVFHLVGMPNMATQKSRRIVHHTLGNGEFDLYVKMTEPVVCAKSILTPENCVAEMDRLVNAALIQRRPVYAAIPADSADLPVVGAPMPSAAPASDPAALEAAVAAIVEMLEKAGTGVILPGVLIPRSGAMAEATAVVEASGLPFAAMVMDKAVLDEAHPQYIGMYDGRLMNPEVRQFVEGADVVLNIGALMGDFSTGAFTARLDPARTVTIMHHNVRVGYAIYHRVLMKDVLAALAKRVPRKKGIPTPPVQGLGDPAGGPKDEITPAYFYPRCEQFLRPGDILVAETGTASMGLGFARMPSGAAFHNQTLWGAIGWATPAAFGAAVAAPDRRTVLVTGEGAHQLTAQEVGQFARYGLKPIIFCLSNGGYLIERVLCKNPSFPYNDVAPWNYHLLPKALGCEGWFAARAATCGELDAAMKTAETCGAGAYIEVVMDPSAVPPLVQKLRDAMKQSYNR